MKSIFRKAVEIGVTAFTINGSFCLGQELSLSYTYSQNDDKVIVTVEGLRAGEGAKVGLTAKFRGSSVNWDVEPKAVTAENNKIEFKLPQRGKWEKPESYTLAVWEPETIPDTNHPFGYHMKDPPLVRKEGIPVPVQGNALQYEADTGTDAGKNIKFSELKLTSGGGALFAPADNLLGSGEEFEFQGVLRLENNNLNTVGYSDYFGGNSPFKYKEHYQVLTPDGQLHDREEFFLIESQDANQYQGNGSGSDLMNLVTKVGRADVTMGKVHCKLRDGVPPGDYMLVASVEFAGETVTQKTLFRVLPSGTDFKQPVRGAVPDSNGGVIYVDESDKPRDWPNAGSIDNLDKIISKSTFNLWLTDAAAEKLYGSTSQQLALPSNNPPQTMTTPTGAAVGDSTFTKPSQGSGGKGGAGVR